MVCATAERRARGAEEAGFRSTSHLKGDRGKRRTQEAKGGGENEESYFCTLGGAMGNSLQHALGTKLFTHHLGEELHGLHSSITIPKAEKPPRSIIHLFCASALLCSSSTTALCSHSPLSCFPSQTRFFIEEVTRTSRKRAG